MACAPVVLGEGLAVDPRVVEQLVNMGFSQFGTAKIYRVSMIRYEEARTSERGESKGRARSIVGITLVSRPFSNPSPFVSIHRFSARGLGVPARAVGRGGGEVPRVGPAAQRRPRLRRAPPTARQASTATRTTTAQQGQVRHEKLAIKGKGKGGRRRLSPPRRSTWRPPCPAWLLDLMSRPLFPLPFLLFSLLSLHSSGRRPRPPVGRAAGRGSASPASSPSSSSGSSPSSNSPTR